LVIRNINFSDEVNDVLQEQLQAILSQSTGLLDPLQEKFQLIDASINQFNPGELVSVQLTPPFEQLVGALSKIEPSAVLSPLQDLQKTLLTQLEPLNPATLLSPLVDVHAQLIAAIQSLSPHELLQPLNDLLAQVTGLLDKLGIEAFINNITESVNKMSSVINDFALGGQMQDAAIWQALDQAQLQGSTLLADIETKLNQFLEQIINSVPDVDIGILQPALDTLQNAVSTIENHMNNPQVLTDINTLVSGLQAQDFSAGMTTLTQGWVVQKARFEAITPPPELAAKYTELKDKLNSLSPITVLATPASLEGTIETSLATLQTGMSETRDVLVKRLAESQADLNALLPAEATASAFKQMLRESLDEQIGTPARTILGTMEALLQEFSNALDKIKAIAQKFKAPFAVLTVLPESITRIGDAIIDAKDKITRINLNFLEDELQGVLDAVITQLDAVNPQTLIASLEAAYQEILDALGGLYPEAAIQSIDEIYQDVILAKINELHPDKTVAQPLDEAFDEILELKEAINIDKIFDALNKKMDTIGEELEEGLERSEKAFKELLAALPSASGGVSASI